MPRPTLTLRPCRRAAALIASLAAVAGTALVAAPAQAAAGVSVDADGRGAVIDSTYSTTLTVKGSGFQSVKGGHGGVYVWFGTVNGTWKPSKGGKSGVNYVYVPDSEAKDNAGFQKYVAFPGSNTASAANGGTMNASGNWSTELLVPGPTFDAVGRNGGTTTVDCRKVTCGVITIGAHGVRNGNNETFTPVKLADLYAAGEEPTDAGATGTVAPSGTTGTSTPTTPGTTPGTTGVGSKSSKKAATAPAALRVDHASATAGRAMSFTATGLTPGEQFTLVLDDGVASVGPFTVPASGTASGVLGLPASLSAGTHEIRVFGASQDVSMKFGVTAGEKSASAVDEEAERPLAAWVFAGVGAAAFLGALGFFFLRAFGGRRADA